MNHDDIAAEPLLERGIARFGGGDLLRPVQFANHGAHPVGLPSFGHLRSETIHQRADLVLPHHHGVDGLPARRQFVEFAHIELAILRQRQRARDRRGSHRQHMWGALALACQHKPLADPEAVLFVDHDHGEIAIGDLVLKDRMGADHDVHTAVEQPHQRCLAHPALVATRQQRDMRAGRFGHAAKALVVLAGKDFGRGQQRGLRARFHRDQHGFQRDHRLARTDIALQQAQHRRLLRHVALNLGNRSLLRARQRERQFEPSAIAPVALQCLAATLAVVRPHQHKREAVGK